MDLGEGKAVVDASLGLGKLCLLVGHCHVHYHGRATSKLSEGDRLLVIKPDGTFLVHQGSKMAAINYQGPGAVVTAEMQSGGAGHSGLVGEGSGRGLPVDGNRMDLAGKGRGLPGEGGGKRLVGAGGSRAGSGCGSAGLPGVGGQAVLVVKAERQKPVREVIEVMFDSLQFAQGFTLKDDSSLKLAGSERQLADLLEQDLGVIEPGLKSLGKEASTLKGAIDIVAEDSTGGLVAIELKRRSAGLDAVTQLARYVKELSHRKGSKIRGVLCSPEITPNALKMLEKEGLEYFKLDYEIASSEAKIKGLQKKQKILGEYR